MFYEDPKDMAPEDRNEEVAAILALGYIRMLVSYGENTIAEHDEKGIQ